MIGTILPDTKRWPVHREFLGTYSSSHRRVAAILDIVVIYYFYLERINCLAGTTISEAEYLRFLLGIVIHQNFIHILAVVNLTPLMLSFDHEVSANEGSG